MSIVIITGDHPRHCYFAQQLVQTGLVTGWVAERREQFVPTPPDDILPHFRDLFVHHFEARDTAEAQFFGDVDAIDVEKLTIDLDELNGPKTKQFIARHSPKIVISYGCHKLDVPFLDPGDVKFWNTHGGLSPDYRGVATHFWPSYMLEPQMTGVTLHETTQELDAGGIVFQVAGTMVRGDGLHQLAARTVSEYAQQLANKLKLLNFDEPPVGKVQRSTGRLFRVADWRPEHLKLIYDTYNDAVVDAQLSGQIVGRTPKLTDLL